MSGWISTYTGRRFWPLDPKTRDVDLLDIAHHLALTNRFNGSTPVPYSVAEHSVRVLQYMREQMGQDEDTLPLLRAGLLHDSAEAYLPDVPSPIKRAFGVAINHEIGLETFVRAERIVHRKIITALCLSQSLTIDRLSVAHEADRVLLATEIRDLLGEDVLARVQLPEPLPDVIQPCSWQQAEAMFLEEAESLGISVVESGTCDQAQS